jgi:hypothetical protein
VEYNDLIIGSKLNVKLDSVYTNLLSIFQALDCVLDCPSTSRHPLWPTTFG